MDLEDRIREAVKLDASPEPSFGFQRRVMERIPSRPGARRFAFPSLPLLVRLGAAAVVVAIVFAAVGVPLLMTRRGIAGGGESASASSEASALPSTPSAEPTTEPTPSPAASPTPTVPARPSPLGKPTPTPSPDIAGGRFVPTGTQSHLYEHAARLLDGGVLFVGGSLDNTAELYDPATGKFGATGFMSVRRLGASVTRLADGRVLVAGGADNGGLSSAELYDPKTGTFTPTGSLSGTRIDHAATLLPDGRVLIAGGFRPADMSAVEAGPIAFWRGSSSSDVGDFSTAVDTPLASAEIYDPRTGRFSPTGSMARPRAGITSVRTNDGRVLVFGGISQDGTTLKDRSAEIYDPKTGRFTATGSLHVARCEANATLLQDGRVLVTDSTFGTRQAEVYDPRTGKFTLSGQTNELRFEARASLLADGRVLLAGGGANESPGSALASAEIWNPKTGKFAPTAPMLAPRYGPNLVLLGNGNVLVTSGLAQDSQTQEGLTAELFEP